MKSTKWCLEPRNGDKLEHYLNCGTTSIGRNPNADINVESIFCSRRHCVITLNENEEIELTDTSNNGTFVNGVKVKLTSKILAANDIIGIGCTLTQGVLDNRYYIYKLTNKELKPPNPVTVDLTLDDDTEEGIVKNNAADDDEDSDDDFTKLIRTEEQNLTDDGSRRMSDEPICLQLPNGYESFRVPNHIVNEGASTSTAFETNNAVEVKKDVNEPENVDEDDRLYSQQILNEMKEEISQIDESFQEDVAEQHEENNDEILVTTTAEVQDDDVEDDGNYQMWYNKLSQSLDNNTQNKVERVKKSIEKKKRRASILIDCIPMPVPVKKRRKSAAEKEVPEKGEKREKPKEAKNETLRRLRRKSIDERKEKLAEIAHQRNVTVEKPKKNEKCSGTTKPKVKTSELRGDFLMQDVPIEHKRRKSVNEPPVCVPKKSTATQKNKNNNNTAAKKENDPAPSTSKESVNTNSKNHINADPLDPFALRIKDQNVKKPQTFEEAFTTLNEVMASTRPTKKRVSRVNAPRKLKSILKSTACGSSNIKKVTFREDEELTDEHYFQIKPGEDREILINPNREIESENDDNQSYTSNGRSTTTATARTQAAASQSSFHSDPLHSIITEITEWNTGWLLDRENSPPINGVDHVLMPMMEKYTSFDSYQNVIMPLLKHELWSSIQSDWERAGRIAVAVNYCNYESRGDTKRFVFHCRVSYDGNKLQSGDFVLVESGLKRFFAYITEVRFAKSGHTKSTSFSMEAAKTNHNDGIDWNTASVTVIPISNIRMELKLFSAIYNLKGCRIRDLILNPMENLVPIRRTPDHELPFNFESYDKLDDGQKEILKNVFFHCINPQKQHLSLIEGPPGTGKSRLIVSLILQLVFGGLVPKRMKILLCASSNAAVDNIAKRLMYIRSKTDKPEKQKMLNIVRHGVLEKMHPDVQKISTQELSKRKDLELHSNSKEINELREQEKSLWKKINNLSRDERNLETVVGNQIDALKKQANQINEIINKKLAKDCSRTEKEKAIELIKGANIVCTTITSSITSQCFANLKFDVCIIEEASQCIEPLSLTPLHFNLNALILVGDSQQLPAVVQSNISRQNGLEKSLFTRLMESFENCQENANIYSLRKQYRMDPEICSWSNKYFYNNQLITVPKPDRLFQLNPYCVFSLDCLQSNADMINYHNMDEAQFIVSLLKLLVKYANPKRYSYGIITPYAKQKTEILSQLKKTPVTSTIIPVNTIDSYQGQEKDIIIISNTRTTGVGFLSYPQRLNVAMTRAKKCLIICGNYVSVKHTKVWKSLLDDAIERKCLHAISDGYTENDLANILLKKK